MAKRKVSQEDLRKMMNDLKSSSSKLRNDLPSSKKFKLSTRERLLLDEQRKEKMLTVSEAKSAPLPPLPHPQAKPQKSILKNKASADTRTITQNPVITPRAEPNASLTISELSEESNNTELLSPQEADPEPCPDSSSPTGSQLPAGFFDDPVQDAKARNVKYVDTKEEEWSRFQKEINEEIATSQHRLVEDRIEATVGRQIEEIDDQIRAWARVAEMEKKKDLLSCSKSRSCEDESFSSRQLDQDMDNAESGEEFEEFMDWRRKL